MPSSFGDAVVDAFFDAIALPETHGLVLDVGANNGDWSRALMDRAAKANLTGSIRFVLIEPQPEFQPRLHRLARRFEGSEVLQAAAWTDAGNLTFHSTKFSEAASLLKPGAGWHVRALHTVRTFDLASSLRSWTFGARGAHSVRPKVLAKLDIEGAEFKVLPRALLSGALCHVHFILIEWHLNRLARAEMLSGFGLRRSFDSQLMLGCRAPPQLVEHDDYFENNFGLPVPGLAELTARHDGDGVPAEMKERIGKYAPADAAEPGGDSTRARADLRLERGVAGFCAKTVSSWAGSCETGTIGNWQLPAGEYAGGWSAAAAACAMRCRRCARCRYVSVSLHWRDCGWFERCDLTRLRTEIDGFRTFAIAAQ